MPKCGIYKITNKINQKVYIGQSINIERRWQDHKKAFNNKNSKSYEYPIYRAFRKYGINNFEFEILEECFPSELDDKELLWINNYNSISKGYNQVKPTQGGIILTPMLVEKIILELQVNKKDNTETIGKNFGISGRTVRSINSGASWYNPELEYPIRSIGIGQQTKKGYNQNNYCQKCGTQIYKTANLCEKCAHEAQRIVDRPSREELKKMIRELPFTQIGKKYEVSDNAIRKWAIYYNLPSKKSDIKKYSNQEWEKL